MKRLSRRAFNKALGLAAAATATPSAASGAMCAASTPTPFALATTTWSFHMPLFRGELKATDMPALVQGLGLSTLEWTAKCFRDLSAGREIIFQAPPAPFFQELRGACDDAGVNSHVVNVGGPFYLSSADAATRQRAIDFCVQYVEPAQALGAKILRTELYCDVPAGPDRDARAKEYAMEGIHALLDRTADTALIINVENHHGISSHPEWLADLIRSMNHPRMGLTADTNNFRTDIDMPYEASADTIPRYVDRYEGLETLMPVANWVSAKTYTFDNTGYEIALDYPRILSILLRRGYAGALSIEYEGNEPPAEGVRKSVEMFQRLNNHIGALDSL